MPESLQSELSVFLRVARDEFLHAPPADQDPLRSLRTVRLAAAMNHLIIRVEADAELAAKARDPAHALADAAPTAKVLPNVDDTDGSVRLAAAAGAVAEAARAASGSHNQDYERYIGRVRDLEVERRNRIREVAARIAAEEGVSAKSRLFEPPALTSEEVEAFLRKTFPDKLDLRVANVKRSAGLYSKENYSLDIHGLDPGPIAAILRRDRAFEIIPTSVANEFELLKDLGARGFLVPRVIAAQWDDALPLRRPVLIMEKVRGAALERLPGALAKGGAQSATPQAILQMAEPLARLHRLDVTSLPIPNPPTSMSRRDAFIATLDEYRDRLHRNQREHYPAGEAGFAWLYNNAYLIDEAVGLIHGDYDLRNTLYEDGKLTAVLDFELAHVGHPAEDLGYLRKDIAALMPWEDFLAAYEAAGGPKVSDALIQYFEIWAYVFFFVCSVCTLSSYRSGRHNDIFFGTSAFIEFEHVTNRLLEVLPGADGVFYEGESIDERS